MTGLGMRERDALLAAIRRATLAMKAATAEGRFEMAMARLGRLLHERRLERRYNPNWPSQPRVPRGNTDGGRWTDGGASGGEELEPSEFEEPVSDDDAGDDRPPEVPKERPERARHRNRFVKRVARWLLRAARVGIRVTPIGRALDVYEAGYWIYDHWPYIEAYQDEPRTLDELRAAVAERKKGYDIHHIVERASGIKGNIPVSWLDGPENLVRIPTLKHWELNKWFETRIRDYGWLTPREYVVGKDKDVRFDVGLAGLRAVGVLK